jgi:hypothetical protein
MTLDEMMQRAADQARLVMVGTKRELEPSWLLITGKGDVEIFMTPWGNDREKRMVIETMRDVMREKRCTAYSFLTEAWMAHATAEERKDGEYHGPPASERPDREECVMTMAANKAGEHRYQMFETVRGVDGTCAELRPSSKEQQWTGIFDNLLDDKRRAS